MESTVFVSLKELHRERKSQSENPLGITYVYSLRSLLTSLDRQLRIKQMVWFAKHPLWSAGDQGSLRLCLGSAAHLRLQLVALQLEGGLHFGSSGGSDISVGVVQ